MPTLQQLSIIIPFAPDDMAWKGLLQDLTDWPDSAEIILVAASEKTKQDAQDFPHTDNIKIISAAMGRAFQMNAGAKAARNPCLWFLHADSRLDANCLRAVDAFDYTKNRLGYFGLRFRNDGPRRMGINTFGAIAGVLCWEAADAAAREKLHTRCKGTCSFPCPSGCGGSLSIPCAKAADPAECEAVVRRCGHAVAEVTYPSCGHGSGVRACAAAVALRAAAAHPSYVPPCPTPLAADATGTLLCGHAVGAMACGTWQDLTRRMREFVARAGSPGAHRYVSACSVMMAVPVARFLGERLLLPLSQLLAGGALAAEPLPEN